MILSLNKYLHGDYYNISYITDFTLLLLNVVDNGLNNILKDLKNLDTSYKTIIYFYLFKILKNFFNNS